MGKRGADGGAPPVCRGSFTSFSLDRSQREAVGMQMPARADRAKAI